MPEGARRGQESLRRGHVQQSAECVEIIGRLPRNEAVCRHALDGRPEPVVPGQAAFGRQLRNAAFEQRDQIAGVRFEDAGRLFGLQPEGVERNVNQRAVHAADLAVNERDALGDSFARRSAFEQEHQPVERDVEADLLTDLARGVAVRLAGGQVARDGDVVMVREGVLPGCAFLEADHQAAVSARSREPAVERAVPAAPRVHFAARRDADRPHVFIVDVEPFFRGQRDALHPIRT
jgi:hypothetical protein